MGPYLSVGLRVKLSLKIQVIGSLADHFRGPVRNTLRPNEALIGRRVFFFQPGFHRSPQNGRARARLVTRAGTARFPGAALIKDCFDCVVIHHSNHRYIRSFGKTRMTFRFGCGEAPILRERIDKNGALRIANVQRGGIPIAAGRCNVVCNSSVRGMPISISNRKRWPCCERTRR